MKKASFMTWVACSLVLHGLLLMAGWMALRSVLGPGRTRIIGQIITAEIFHQEKAVVAGPRPAVEAAPLLAKKPAKKEAVKNPADMRPSEEPVNSPDQQDSAALTGAAESGKSGPAGLPESQTSANHQAAVLSSNSSVPAKKVVGGQPSGPDVEIISEIHSIVSKSVVYPPAALRSGLEGVVKVSFRIAKDGRPIDIRVDGTSGYSILDEAAIKAVEKGKTYPVIAKTVMIPVRFSLK